MSLFLALPAAFAFMLCSGQHDPLTKLWNRYKIEEYIGMELHRLTRSKTSFSLFMIDIDDFKAVNHSYGHLQGDRVLVELGQ